MRVVVVLFLVAIVASLASALMFLLRDQGRDSSRRMVKTLALRVGLSALLFALLATGYYSGLITDRL